MRVVGTIQRSAFFAPLRETNILTQGRKERREI